MTPTPPNQDTGVVLTRDDLRVLLGRFLAAEGLTGQLLNRQAAKVYDGAINAMAALTRTPENR